MKKGIVISTIGWLVIAIVALVILFIFFMRISPFAEKLIESAVKGFVDRVCDFLPWGIRDICHWLTGT
jgi:hypothetical protein